MTLLRFTHREIFFEILLNQTEIWLYLLFSEWFRSKRTVSVWIQIDRKIVNTIRFLFDLIRFLCVHTTLEKYFLNLSKSNQILIVIYTFHWYVHQTGFRFYVGLNVVLGLVSVLDLVLAFVYMLYSVNLYVYRDIVNLYVICIMQHALLQGVCNLMKCISVNCQILMSYLFLFWTNKNESFQWNQISLDFKTIPPICVWVQINFLWHWKVASQESDGIES